MPTYASIQRDFEEEKSMYFRPPPHDELLCELLRTEAEAAILHGIEHFRKDRDAGIFGGRQFNINIGIGTELLLKSILVKKNKPIFKDGGNSVSLGDCIYVLKKILNDEILLDRNAIGRIDYVLRTIKLRRDNIAHLSLTRASSYRTPPQIFRVLEFLMATYFGECALAIELRELTEKERVSPKFPEMDYEPINFTICSTE